MNEEEDVFPEWITMSPQYGFGDTYGRGFWTGSGQSVMYHYGGENASGAGRSFGNSYGCSFSSGKGFGNEVNK